MPELPLGDIQGLVLRSYGMDVLRLFLLRVHNGAGARAMLGLLPVQGGAMWDRKPDFCLNVALTYDGLAALGLPAEILRSFPADFVEGAVNRADKVCDTGPNAPANWKPEFRGPEVHVAILLFAQSPEILESQTTALRATYSVTVSVSEIFVLNASVLPGNVAHFGYRDGFSQPTIDGGLANPVPDILPKAPAGEFLLGYESQFDQLKYPVPSQIGSNGSYLALRVLEQDCATFDKLLNESQERYGIAGELLAAKMCGRWRNGVPLALSPDTASPEHPIPLEKLNGYDYVPTAEHPEIYDDSKGYRCPIGSHMRRNNPRNSRVAGASGLKHRIVRRGLPYGPPFDPLQPDDGIERGLLGLFIVASLKDQFEFLMSDWVNGGLFAPGLGGTRDPILGNNSDGSAKFVIPVDGGDKIVVAGFSNLVTTRGGAYCFVPSLPALRLIAGLP